MPTLKPKFTRPVLAIRLKTEIIAPVGDWLVIDQETEEVAHLTEAQVTMIYGRPSNGKESKPDKAPAKRQSRKVLDADRMLSGQAGRYFYILVSAGRPLTEREVNEHSLPGDKKSSSAALSVMKSLDLVERIGLSEHRHGQWQPTERGQMVFKRLELACFKRFGIPVPDPSRLSEATTSE